MTSNLNNEFFSVEYNFCKPAASVVLMTKLPASQLHMILKSTVVLSDALTSIVVFSNLIGLLISPTLTS